MSDHQQHSAEDINLRLGKEFATFHDFESLLQSRTKLLSEKWVKDTGGRTIQQANSKIGDATLHFREDFVYAFVNFRCIHGGKFKSRGTQKNRQSHKIGCPASIALSARRKTDCMVITKLNLEHNHELIPDTCGYYHDDRKPTEIESVEIGKMVKLGLSAGKIMTHMSETSGKIFRRHDIHNISKQSTGPQRPVEDEVWQILKRMCREDSSSQYSVRADSDGNVSTLLFQTGAMRRILAEYGDVVYIDGTYCLNNLGYPLYVFLCVDGENKGHVVSYAVVRDERKTTLSQVFSDFVSNIDIEIKTVVVDKDAAEISAIKETMPGTKILLCRFHVAQSLRAAAAKYCSVAEKLRGQDCVMKMLYTASEDEFVSMYSMLPSRFQAYMDRNWMPNKESWAQCFTKHLVTWGTKTNNFVERHNRTLKTLSTHTKSLPTLISKILAHHRHEEHGLAIRAADAVYKTRVYQTSADVPYSHVEHCSSFLSHAACKSVIEQMEKLFSATYYRVEGENVFIKQGTEEVMFPVHNNTCTCLFYLNYMLPCWHLMAFYLSMNMPLVQRALVPRRWTKTTLLSTFGKNVPQGNSAALPASVTKKKPIMNEIQKREEASKLWDNLVNVMISCGQNSFEVRCKVLLSVMDSWNEGTDIPTGMILENQSVAENGVELEEGVDVSGNEVILHAGEQMQRNNLEEGEGMGVVNAADGVQVIVVDEMGGVINIVEDEILPVDVAKDEMGGVINIVEDEILPVDVAKDEMGGVMNVVEDEVLPVDVAENEMGGVMSVVEDEVLPVDEAKEVDNVRSNVVVEDEMSFVHVAENVVGDVIENELKEGVSMIVADDHNYFAGSSGSSMAIENVLSGFTFQKCIKKRGRPKGAGKTSGHYSKKRKTAKMKDCESAKSALQSDEFIGTSSNVCYACRKELCQDGTSGAWLQWIECESCLKWFHKVCIFGESKRVPKTFICMFCNP